MASAAGWASAATLIALAFGLSTFERWHDGGQPEQLAWTVALACFVGGSAALWVGASVGWEPWSFRVFYTLGAIVNVPILALGTVWLLAPARTARRWTIAVGLACAAALGLMVSTPFTGELAGDALPRGSDVFGPLPRVLAAVFSGGGATVLFAGAVASAVRLVRGHGPPRLAVANGLIAAGTLILSAGGLGNSVLGEMEAFAASLVVGVSLLFGGFLVTNRRPVPPTDPGRTSDGAADQARLGVGR